MPHKHSGNRIGLNGNAFESEKIKMLELLRLTAGEYSSNCYLIRNPETLEAMLVDPGGEAEEILAWIGPASISRILLTHGHKDHVGALQTVRETLGVPVGIHELDAEAFGLEADLALLNGESIAIGNWGVEVVHIPGHTPGSVAFRLQETKLGLEVVAGDAIFPGGPGHTRTPQDLTLSLESLARTVFTWPDATLLHPGHGGETTVGAERADFEAFRKGPPSPDLCGDVLWRVDS